MLSTLIVPTGGTEAFLTVKTRVFDEKNFDFCHSNQALAMCQCFFCRFPTDFLQNFYFCSMCYVIVYVCVLCVLVCNLTHHRHRSTEITQFFLKIYLLFVQLPKLARIFVMCTIALIV